MGMTSGTAGPAGVAGAASSGVGAGGADTGDCNCQCMPNLPIFRDDLNICVDDIHGEFFFSFVSVFFLVYVGCAVVHICLFTFIFA